MYAKIINDETKECSVGLGNNIEFYISQGMTEIDVEHCWNGSWYLKGYSPEKPSYIIKQERIKELKRFLSEADYWGQKYIDGEYTQEEWEEKKAQRKAWREEIRRLEDEIEVDDGSNNGVN